MLTSVNAVSRVLVVALTLQRLVSASSGEGAVPLLERAGKEAQAITTARFFLPPPYLCASTLMTIARLEAGSDPAAAEKSIALAREAVEKRGPQQLNAPVLAAITVFEEAIRKGKATEDSIKAFEAALEATPQKELVLHNVLRFGVTVSLETTRTLADRLPDPLKKSARGLMGMGLAEWSPGDAMELLSEPLPGPMLGQQLNAVSRAVVAMADRNKHGLRDDDRRVIARAVAKPIQTAAQSADPLGANAFLTLVAVSQRVGAVEATPSPEEIMRWADAVRPRIRAQMPWTNAPSNEPAQFDLLLACVLKSTDAGRSGTYFEDGIAKLEEWRTAHRRWLAERQKTLGRGPIKLFPGSLDDLMGSLLLADPETAERVLAKTKDWEGLMPLSACWAPLAVDAAYTDVDRSNEYLRKISPNDHDLRSLVLIHQARALLLR